MDLFLLALLSFLLGGSGNDLLDYVPVDLYWRVKQVDLSAATIMRELQPATDVNVTRWINDLDASDPAARTHAYEHLLHAGPSVLIRLRKIRDTDAPEPSRRAAHLVTSIEAAPRRDAVRRLMALRTLGELRARDALPVLRSFLDSKDVFVAEYASAAIAKIEGKPFSRSRAPNTQKDVWLLPADAAVIGHLNLRSGQPLDYEKVFKQIPLGDKQDPAGTVDFIAGKALEIAELVGNLRLDTVTASAGDSVEDSTAHAIFIFSGQFDGVGIGDYSSRAKFPFQNIDGSVVYQPDAETFLFTVSDQKLVIVASKKGDISPVKGMIAACKSGHGTITDSPGMEKLITQMNLSNPVSGCMNVTDSYRKTALLSAFTTITVSGERQGDGVLLSFQGNGNDTAKNQSAAERLKHAVAALTSQVRRYESVMPSLKLLSDSLAGVSVENAGDTVTLRASVRESPADSFLLPFLLIYGVRETHPESVPRDP